MDVFFYEAFAEEAEALQNCLRGTAIKAGFTPGTIQEHCGKGSPPISPPSSPHPGRRGQIAAHGSADQHHQSADPCAALGPLSLDGGRGVGDRGDLFPPAPLISIRTQSRIPVGWADKLSGILSRSTGYDHLTDYLGRIGRDISCGYLPLYCNRAVAEQTMLLWMTLLRRLPQQLEHFNAFDRDGITGAECEHKTLLVVGVGHIGSEVARIGRGLGMEVLGIDIAPKDDSIPHVSIAEGLPRADVIVCAMNLNPHNRGYFHYDLLKHAKPGAIFINIARGELSPAADLERLLDEGRLAGVALDVYNHESELAVSLRTNRPSTDPEVLATLALARRPNVVLTPHNAFNTIEAVTRKAEHSIRQIEHVLSHGNFLWTVPSEIY